MDAACKCNRLCNEGCPVALAFGVPQWDTNQYPDLTIDGLDAINAAGVIEE
jgi:hypothetical protein